MINGLNRDFRSRGLKDAYCVDIGLTTHEANELKIGIVAMLGDPTSGCVVLEKGRIDFFSDEIMTDVVKVRIILPVKHFSG